ncbi:MAG: MarR family transcriptional regulator [Acidobacteria bacterium]|nr:MAG: MarR family transcriptional regulator [Acidobacteriota bacterium]
MGSHTSTGSPDTRVVLDAVRRIVQALHESSRWAEKHLGLTGAQLFVLQKLAESPCWSVNELAARTHTHQSSVSAVVARLVERGLVIRGSDETDARRVELRLSPHGRKLIRRAPNLPQQRLIHGIERLPASGRRALAASLDALTSAMAVNDHDAVMFFDEARRRGRRTPRNG